jgi:hypothetical protein
VSAKVAKTPMRAPSPGPRRLSVCIATARSGKRCRCAPLRGSKYCALHTEGIAAKLGEKGGRRRAIFNPDKLLRFEPPKTVDECLSILGQIAAETHRGEIDPRVASTVSGILNTLLAGIEVKEQGALLAELERRTGLQDSLSQLRDEVTGRFSQ